MKFFLSALICILMIGSVFLYIDTRKEASHLAGSEKLNITTAYDLDLLTTAALEPDPFSSSKKPASVMVLLNGEKVLDENRTLKSMNPMKYKGILRIKTGPNELYIEASSSHSDTSGNFALRVRIVNGKNIVSEKTFWSDGENTIRGTFPFEIKREE